MENSEKNKRWPVVVIMGHIDHGKSTLLDYIRKSNVVVKEVGGITQKMSAYEVEWQSEDKKNKITFLDPPGHEAFQAIRTRGAKVADVAVLVVAADDGVKPQTLEALKCIKEEKMPFIVAINKIDKPEADLNKTRNSLTENEIYLEGFGGDIPSVAISAKTGENIPELLELIILSADIENLTGDPEKLAEGVVIESHLDPKTGIAATLIIKDGTLKKGMYLKTEDAMAPVKIMEDFTGDKIDEAVFSSPIKIIGWSEAPKVGTQFKSFKNKKEAESFSFPKIKIEDKKDSSKKEESNDGEEESQKIIIPVIIKADSAGSLEAMEHELKKLEGEKVEFKVLSASIGMVSENDLKSALAAKNTIILGFNVKIDNQAKNLAEREEITVKIFDIIYKMTDWLKTDMTKLLPKVKTEEITGEVKVIKIFSSQKDKQIIGGKVTVGSIKTSGSFRIKRRENLVGEGKVKGLEQKKEKTTEVREGNEFGGLVEAKMPISPGDILEFFEIKEQLVQI